MKILALSGDGIGLDITDATRTADLGGRLGTRAFARHVAALIG